MRGSPCGGRYVLEREPRRWPTTVGDGGGRSAGRAVDFPATSGLKLPLPTIDFFRFMPGAGHVMSLKEPPAASASSMSCTITPATFIGRASAMALSTRLNTRDASVSRENFSVEFVSPRFGARRLPDLSLRAVKMKRKMRSLSTD